MIKVWNSENNKKVTTVLNQEELEFLKSYNIDENMMLSEVQSKIIEYLIKKYKLIVLSDIDEERMTLSIDDKRLFELYKVINKEMDRLS